MNLDELLLFEPKMVVARPFKEFGEYRGIPLWAYDPTGGEGAPLTRRGVVARDLFDVITLEMKGGLRAGDFREEVLEKVRFSLRYERYRERLALNLEELLEMSGKEFLELLEGGPTSKAEFIRRFMELKGFLASMRT